MYDREPLYVISVAARLLDMHAQTLRKYEREQFIKPSRTQGRLRLYSAEDIERLRQIKHLVEGVGLNLAGVELALGMSQRLAGLRDKVRDATSQEDAAAIVESEIAMLLLALGVPEGSRNANGREERPARDATADKAAAGRGEPGKA